jgi:F-type H+-transporting ATPase subunit delta
MKVSRKAKRQAKRLFRFCTPGGVMDEGRVRDVMARIIQGGYRDRMAILRYFQKLVKLYFVCHSARIESANGMSAELRGKIEAELNQRYGELNTTVAQNPALIGGVRVQVGSDVYDGSVRARLSALARNLGIEEEL